MTDFFALPGDYAAVPYTDPNRSHTPSVPLDSSDGMGGVVQSDEADWRKRAKIAREGAEELEEAAKELDRVLWTNYFGDCAEGIAVYENLTSVIDTWKGDLRSQSLALRELATQCADAALRLEDADSAGARSIET
ncbi:hypothetical protein GCM10009624_26840 [Gordonia sinesedis]